jgi:hypothetical protein
MALRNVRFDVEIPLGSSERAVEQSKETFWLNILNFMTLLKIAEICLINPALMRKMKSYAMWQTMW